MSLLPGRLYSNDSAEEARLLEIRNSPGDRVRLIVKARIRNRNMPLHELEWMWIKEDFDRSRIIPVLSPLEWDALFGITRRIIGNGPEAMARETKAREDWEKHKEPR